MASSLSSLADYVSDGLRKDKCKNCESNLKYVTVKNNTLTFKREGCHKNYEHTFNKDLA